MSHPELGPRVRAVAARLGARRDQHELALRHLLDLALGDPQLRRVDEVVGRVHEHDAAP